MIGSYDKLDMIDYARLWSQSNQSSTSSLVSYDDMIVRNSWARQLSLLACCWELLLCGCWLVACKLVGVACWVWSVVLSCVVLCCPVLCCPVLSCVVLCCVVVLCGLIRRRRNKKKQQG